MRLIMFSGGVESAAMLHYAEKKDIIVTLTHSNVWNDSTMASSSAKIFTDYYGLELIEVKIDQTRYDAIFYGGQINWLYFVFLDHLVINNPAIDEIWLGYNYPEIFIKQGNERIKSYELWNQIHPTVELVYATVRYEKHHCWNIIPNELKPFVKSCSKYLNKNCGKCGKCKEMMESIKRYNNEILRI